MLNVITNFIRRYCSCRDVVRIGLWCAVALCGGCNIRDSELGESLIPDNQLMYTEVDSSMTIKTYILSGDTLATNRCGAFYWGAKNDDCGVMKAEFAAQFSVEGVVDELSKGKVEVDSLTITLAVKGTLGECEGRQQMSIYTLKERLYRDSVYYSDYDVEGLMQDLLGNFCVSGNPSKYTYKVYDVRQRTDSLVVRWVEKLIDTANYSSDSTFYSVFPGLGFKRSMPNYGAVYEIDPEQSYMTLYYKSVGSVADITRSVKYSFSQRGNSANAGVSHIEYDYSDAKFIRCTDSTGLVEAEYCTVQTLGGMKSLFEISGRQLETLKHRVIAQGYQNVAINRAVLTFSTIMPTDSAIEQALNQIGLYDFYRGYLSEYDAVEMDKQPKKMVLNRVNGSYSVDLTSEIVKMMRDGDSVRRIVMASIPGYNQYGLQQVIVGGGGAKVRGPKLKIKFTSIGKFKDYQPEE